MRLPLLVLHILGGTIGLLAGTFSIAVRKGNRLHRAAGNVFTLAMLTLASSSPAFAFFYRNKRSVYLTVTIAIAVLLGLRSLHSLS